MEKLNTIVYGLVSLVVVVLVVSTVALPVVQDAQNDQFTIEQNTGEKFSLREKDLKSEKYYDSYANGRA